MPSESYGNGWLRVTHKGRELASWPRQGDPYCEIYKLRGNWYSLFVEDWINPCGFPPERGGGTFERTCRYLGQVQYFHRAIAGTYHPNSYAHYGADRGRQSFGEVVWAIDKDCTDPAGWYDWQIVRDNRQGTVDLVPWNSLRDTAAPDSSSGKSTPPVRAQILPPEAAGDQTVPAKSADHQLKSGLFKGVFRQTGYEHQSSYKDPRAIASTLYSIVRIAQKAVWTC